MLNVYERYAVLRRGSLCFTRKSAAHRPREQTTRTSFKQSTFRGCSISVATLDYRALYIRRYFIRVVTAKHLRPHGRSAPLKSPLGNGVLNINSIKVCTARWGGRVSASSASQFERANNQRFTVTATSAAGRCIIQKNALYRF